MERKVCTPQMGRRLFWLCFITYMLSCLGRYNYMAVMAELITREGFSKSGAGLVGTALFVVYGVCQMITGPAGDRVSPKKMIAFGLIGSGIMNLLMGCVSTQPVMLALWMANGVFQACMWSPVARLFAEMLPAAARTRACSNAAATIPVASILVYLLSAGSIRFLSWRFAFWIPGGVMLAAAVVWLPCMTLVEKHTARYGVMEQAPCIAKGKQGSLWQIAASAGLLFIAVGALSHGLLKDGIQSWMPTFLTESFHMTTYASVVISLILPVCSIGGVLLTRWLAANYIKNELRAAGVCFAAAFASLGVLAACGTENGLFSLATLTVASTAMIGANILLINLIPMHFGAIGRASTITGLLNCSAYAGSAISSFGIGAVAERAGWNGAIWFWLVFAAAAFAASLLGARKWGAYTQNF